MLYKQGGCVRVGVSVAILYRQGVCERVVISEAAFHTHIQLCVYSVNQVIFVCKHGAKMSAHITAVHINVPKLLMVTSISLTTLQL